MKDIGGADGDVMLQLKGVAMTLLYSGVVSFVLLKAIDAVTSLRVAEEEEREGLDLVLRGEAIE